MGIIKKVIEKNMFFGAKAELFMIIEALRGRGYEFGVSSCVERINFSKSY
jgi:hypothetical protein